MRKIELTIEEVKEVIRLYQEELMGSPSIAKEMGYHKVVIIRTLKENGIEMGSSGRRDLGGKSASDKRNYHKHKEKKKQYSKVWGKENRTHMREYHAKWREENKEHVNEYKRKYERERKANDPKYRLGANTRTALYTCLKEAKVDKYRSTFELLGYSLDELMVHLEAKFTDGMTWDNYGEWHVDHMIPMALYDFISTECAEFKECWSLSNLQPLWGVDNLSKGSRFLS